MRRILLAALIVLAVAHGGCAIYSPGYVTRVLLRRDANTDDFLWKHTWRVPASTAPTPLPHDEDRRPAILRAFETVAGQPVESFMASSASRSLLIVHRGRIVLEAYANGGGATDKQATFSVTKSILSLLVGRALESGGIASLGQPVTQALPELLERDERFAAITLASLLDMRSGLAYSTRSRFPWVTNDAPLVYYAHDLRSVVLTKSTIETAPGAFHYNDFNPNLLALVLERRLGADQPKRLLADFWNDLGAEDDALLTTDDRGFGAWDSGLVATARDLSKVGLLMLNPAGPKTELVSPAWRRRIVTLAHAPTVTQFDGRQWAYHSGWWHILRPDGHNDLAAIGRFGQFVYVSPRYDTVIVRTGGDKGAPGDGQLAAWFYALAGRL